MSAISSSNAELHHGPQIPKPVILIGAIFAFVIALALAFPRG